MWCIFIRYLSCLANSCPSFSCLAFSCPSFSAHPLQLQCCVFGKLSHTQPVRQHHQHPDSGNGSSPGDSGSRARSATTNRDRRRTSRDRRCPWRQSRAGPCSSRSRRSAGSCWQNRGGWIGHTASRCIRHRQKGTIGDRRPLWETHTHRHDLRPVQGSGPRQFSGPRSPPIGGYHALNFLFRHHLFICSYDTNLHLPVTVQS